MNNNVEREIVRFIVATYYCELNKQNKDITKKNHKYLSTEATETVVATHSDLLICCVCCQINEDAFFIC